mgnify:FL=1
MWLCEDGEPSLLCIVKRLLVCRVIQCYKRATSVEVPLNSGGVSLVFCRFAPAILGGVVGLADFSARSRNC